jgi:hypothetical protein
MTVLRILLTVGLSVLLGILIWLAISGVLYVVLDNRTGWPPFSPGAPADHVKGGLIVGALNGLLAAVGLILTIHRGSLGASLVASIITTEVGLAIAQAWFFIFMDTKWKPATMVEAVQSSLLYFLFFSAILFVPTLFISFVVGYFITPARVME